MARSNVPPEVMWYETYNIIFYKKNEPELGQGCRTEFQFKKEKSIWRNKLNTT